MMNPGEGQEGQIDGLKIVYPFLQSRDHIFHTWHVCIIISIVCSKAAPRTRSFAKYLPSEVPIVATIYCPLEKDFESP